MAGAAQKLANDLADIRRRLIALERGSQLSHTTITGPDGALVRLPDGVRTGITASAQAAEAIDKAATAEAKADGAVVSYFGTVTPADPKEGDFWRKSDAEEPLQFVNGVWTAIVDPALRQDVDEALDRISTTEATVDHKITTYFAPLTQPPTAAAIGDLWFVEGTNHLRRWDGQEWVDARDAGIEEAQSAANAAQSTADNAASAAQTAQSTADTAKANAATAQSAADSAASAAQTAQSTADTAKSDAATAAGIAEGKADVLIQSTAPAVEMRKSTTLWIDTTNGANTPKRWDGAAWLAVTDKTATDAANAAATAQSTADNAASAAAQAQTSADNAASAAQTAQTTADNAASAAQSAQSTADSAASAASAAQSTADNAASAASAAQSTADTAKSDAATAAGIAEGKADVLIQSTVPGADMQKATTLWIDTTNGENKPKRWNATASTWDVVTDKAATDAANAAATAQSTADTAKANAATAQSTADAAASAASAAQSRADEAHSLAGTAESNAQSALSAASTAQSSADNAQSTADSRPLILFDTVAPSGTAPQGSTWFQVNSAGQVIGQWQQTAAGSASTWTVREITNEIISNLDVGKLVAGSATISSAVAEKIIAEVVEAQVITGPTIQSAPPGSQRTLMDATGFHAYLADGTETIRLGNGDNLLTGRLYTNGPGLPGLVLIPVTSTERPGIWFSEDGATGSTQAAIYADSTHWALTLRGKSGAAGGGGVRLLNGAFVQGSLGGSNDLTGPNAWYIDSSGYGGFTALSASNEVVAKQFQTAYSGQPGLVLLNTTAGQPGIWFSSDGSLSGTQPAIYADPYYTLFFRGKAAGAGNMRFATGARIYDELEYYDPPTSTFGANLGISSSPKDRFYKLTSKRSSKVNIHDYPVEYASRVLDLSPRLWLDRTQVEERIGKDVVTEDPQTGPKVPEHVIAAHRMKRQPTEPRLREIPGLVAEEVEAAGLKEYVTYADDPETGEEKVEGVSYDRLWTLLIPLVKELRDRVAALEETKAPKTPHAERIAALERENAEQEERLSALEARLADLEAQ